MSSKKKLLFLIFLFPYFLPGRLFAAPSLIITTYPLSVIAGQEFDVTFSASDLVPSTTYYAKSLGGEGLTEVDTWNSSWL